MTSSKGRTETSPLRVIMTLGDRDDLVEMMDTLNETDISLHTEDIARDTLDDSRTATIDLGKLTEKQRETLEIALEAGYYEQPRKTDLATLADQIGISKSAVSQRLRAAESKLVKNALRGYN